MKDPAIAILQYNWATSDRFLLHVSETNVMLCLCRKKLTD